MKEDPENIKFLPGDVVRLRDHEYSVNCTFPDIKSPTNWTSLGKFSYFLVIAMKPYAMWRDTVYRGECFLFILGGSYMGWVDSQYFEK